MSLGLPKCDFCKHLYEDIKDDYCCAAFPDGVPLDAMIADEDMECNNEMKYEEE